ncbi:MAG: hypothetical protein B9S33_11560 [Pedosphaera sp. Tous-C6FEB]|nr:MAG: hypothetical protein B9S33_11560 [Pedosphaera sp. Tous-C6FEB]
MSDTVRLTRSAPPTAKDTVRLPRVAKPSMSDTVRIDRLPAKTNPTPPAGSTLDDFLKQQKPHVDPPPQK